MSAAVDPGMRYGQLLSQPDLSLGQQASPPMEPADASDKDVNENATLRISSPLDLEVAEKLSIQLNNKQTSLTADLEKQESDLDTLWKTIKSECKAHGISVDQEPIRSKLAQIHKLEVIRKEHAKTLTMLRGEYHERLKLITAKRSTCSSDAQSPTHPPTVTSPPAMVASPPTMVTSPPMTSSPALITPPPPPPPPPNRPVAVVSANINSKIRPRVGRQRSLPQSGRTPDKRRHANSDVIGMRTSPPIHIDNVQRTLPPPLPVQQQQPTVFNMMSQHMTVNMLAHPNQGHFMGPSGHDLTKAATEAMIFGAQPAAPHHHPQHNPNAYTYPNQTNNNNNHAYNTMITPSHMNGMTDFYTMQSHSNISPDMSPNLSPNMSPDCPSRQPNQFVGLDEADKLYHIPPDPTDPNLGKRMLRNLLMGEKPANDGGVSGGHRKVGQVFHQSNIGTSCPRMAHCEPLMVHKPSPPYRDIGDHQRHILKPHYHLQMPRPPPHHIQQQQVPMSSGSHLHLHHQQQHQQQHQQRQQQRQQQQQQQQQQQHQQRQQQQHHSLGICNPSPFIEEPPLNLDETLSKEIMQLDDQMLQASLDVAGLLPEQWENIQLTDEDYL